MKDSEAVPKPADGLAVRRIGKETIILTESGEELHTLDETGSFVWFAIDGERTLAQILDMLCAEYEVSRAQARADLRVFIDVLREKEIIRLISADC